MEWDPTERDAWVTDAQRWIAQINGVLQCKIDLDEAGGIAGVHVVAGMERDPRHIVRDVESLLKARLDLDVYYKKIGVVQVVDNGPRAGTAEPDRPAARAGHARPGPVVVPGSGVTFHPPRPSDDHADDVPLMPPPSAAASQPGGRAGELPDPIPAILVAEDLDTRIVCGGVGVMASEATLRAEVHLRAGSVEARGLREGPNHAESDIQLVAQAALAAVTELVADPVLLHLREVRLLEVGGKPIVLTAIDLVEGRQSTTLFGTCGTSHNRQQAVVHAVLDALNRRLALSGLKTLKGTA